MARPDKQATVAELTEEFRESAGAVLTEYRGLTVEQITELRTALGREARYAVVKNTLSKIAAREAGLDQLVDLLQGPSAIAFVKGDPVVVAKGLRDFARANPVLVVKGGVLDGRPLSADEIRRLADLESREVLLAKFAGAAKASLSQAVSMFAAPLSQFARLAAALRDQAPAEPAAAEPAAEAAEPAAEEPVTETPTAEEPTAEEPTAEEPTAEAPAAAEPEAAAEPQPAAEAEPAAEPANQVSTDEPDLPPADA